MKTTTILIGLAGLMVTAVVAAEVQDYATAATSDQSAAAVVDAQGNLRVPEDYRIAYQLLGAWAIAADQGAGSKELHVVYASPGTIAAYRKDGHFPDGSVLVKEVFATDTQPMTTGTVSHAQTLKGWFVMVRDSRDTHPGNKHGVRAGVGHGSTLAIRVRRPLNSKAVSSSVLDWRYNEDSPAKRSPS
jgi:hypothetical protein